MRRRDFLVLGAGLALPGCSSSRPAGDAGTATSTPSPTSTHTPIRSRVGEVDLPVPRAEMRSALPRDAIPAITEPAFATAWTGRDGPTGPLPELPDEDPVIGVTRNGKARAYPLRILNRHEVVNDTFQGPLLVTYCVLCGSAVVAERRVAGSPTLFGVSGLLWRSDLVMYDDATDSLWSQILATAINGPRTGEQLTLVPSSLTSWGEWQKAYPDTRVLLPPPNSDLIADGHFELRYNERQYGYDDDSVIGYEPTGEALHPKTLVVGIAHNGTAVAYPFPAVAEVGVINDTVSGLPVVVTMTPGGELVAYERRIDGRTLAFEPADEATLRAGGSHWERATGRAVDGPFEGRRLVPTSEIPSMFWRGWQKFHPNTLVWTPEGRRTSTPTPTDAKDPY